MIFNDFFNFKLLLLINTTPFNSLPLFSSEIIRTDDYHTKQLKAIEADDFYTLVDSDFADVNCKSKSGDV